MTYLTVHTAGPSDLRLVEQLLQKSYPRILARDYDAGLLKKVLPRITRARPSLLASGSYYLMRAEDDVVAIGGWTRSDPWGGEGQAGLGHIRHVASDPDRVRQGLGRRLMAHICAEAQEAAICQLDCYSTLSARAFYTAMGFEDVAEITMNLGPGVAFPAVHMRKAL